jgi:hypothetical protein
MLSEWRCLYYSMISTKRNAISANADSSPRPRTCGLGISGRQPGSCRLLQRLIDHRSRPVRVVDTVELERPIGLTQKIQHVAGSTGCVGRLASRRTSNQPSSGSWPRYDPGARSIQFFAGLQCRWASGRANCQDVGQTKRGSPAVRISDWLGEGRWHHVSLRRQTVDQSTEKAASYPSQSAPGRGDAKD